MKTFLTAAAATAAMALAVPQAMAQGLNFGGAGGADYVSMNAVPVSSQSQPAGYVNPYSAGYPVERYGSTGSLYETAADAAAGGTAAEYGSGLYAESGYGERAASERTGGCRGTHCGGCDSCCRAFWEHRTGVFGDFLYLQPRGADVAYAVPRDGIDLATSVPFGEVAVANPDYSAGYRLGFNWATSRCSSWTGAYTRYQGETNSAVFTEAPLVLHSLVTHPATATAASDSLLAEARYDIQFDLIDIAYRRLLSGGRNYAINYSIGSRYAFMDQEFSSVQPIGPGITGVATDIEFSGGGTRIGFDCERRLCRRLFWYGRGSASVLVGEFDSDYRQFNNFQLTQAFTGWEDDRAISILDYELGMGWENARGNLRVSGGYYFAAWFNMVTTSQYIQAVQTNNYVDLGDTITFDGATARIEYRW